jgi:ABC-type transport system involved in multi-copper enzyme maturation permease subunit
MASSARWLTGPVFDKELRVASRQRKYYVLRFVYVCLLVLVTVQFWFAVVRVGGGASGVVQVSRLGTAGQTIIATIIGFQFITGQLLAAVLLSDAISSEIRRRTLEGLLVTPIGALHIVLGKLLSKLLQLVLLLAISLPVLAVVRVFGGVPWDYVVAGLCITLSGSVFAGSLSLFCSIRQRHAYQAVLVVALWYLVIWGLVPMPLMSFPAAGYLSYQTVAFVLSLTNPCLTLFARTQEIFRGPSGATASAPLLLHCLTILALAALILALSVRRVRKTVVAHRTGSLRAETIHHAANEHGVIRRFRQAGEPIRRVKGAPVVWKDLCTPLFQARRQVLFHAVLWIGVAGFVLVAVFFFGPRMHGSFFIPIVILQWLFIIRLGVAAAGSITREKEAGTWPILLATPLSDHEIVKGKLIAAFRRNVPLLIPLAGLYLFAALVAPPRYELGGLVLVLSVAVSLLGSVVFLLGVGMYLSTRLKTTAGAVASTLALYFVPKLFCCGVPGPLFLLAPAGSGASFNGMFAVTLVAPVFHVTVGLLCRNAALRRLRRDIFR